MSDDQVEKLESIGLQWVVPSVQPDLKRHDLWHDRFLELKKYMESHGDCNVPYRHEHLGRWISYQRRDYRLFKEGKTSPMSDDRIRKLESIGFQWISERMQHDLWHDRFQELKKYMETHGDCNVPQRHGSLGTWISNQRSHYRLLKEGKISPMSDDRIRKLDSIDFQWISKRMQHDLWQNRLQELRRYKETHGSCNVPYRCGSLGTWISTQRHNYRLLKEGKSSPMTDDRIRELESIGFQWILAKERVSDLWRERFLELKKYMETHGDCNVPKRHGSLGTWISTQRSNYRLLKEGKTSPMSDDRIRKLESIDFQWISKRMQHDLWQNRLQELKRYKETHGNCDVRMKHGSLGTWISTQRHNYRLLKEGKSSPMTDDRIRELESIGFQWILAKERVSDLWRERFLELKKYVETHGDCNVPQRHGSLGTWISTQRSNYRLLKEGKMSPMSDDRIRKLESIDFQWISKRMQHDLWQNRLQELRRYKETHGNCDVSRSSGSLGTWISTQRSNYRLLKEGKASPMSTDRIRKLESIGFCWSHKRRRDSFEAYQHTTDDTLANSKSGS